MKMREKRVEILTFYYAFIARKVIIYSGLYYLVLEVLSWFTSTLGCRIKVTLTSTVIIS
jgi:hypothetical protein